MRSLLLFAALMLSAAPAHAVGVDLSIGACPNNAGAVSTGTLDCTGGQSLTLLVTFMPAEPISDLTGIVVVLQDDFYCDGPYCCSGDMNTTQTFWNFGLNTQAWSATRLRPSAGCVNYLDTWDDPAGGSAAGGASVSNCASRITAVCFRKTLLSVQANQRLFGVQLTIDAGAAIEAGGTLTGCQTGLNPATIVLEEVDPSSASSSPTTLLTSPSVFGQVVRIAGIVPVVAAKRATWGQIKSLYR